MWIESIKTIYWKTKLSLQVYHVNWGRRGQRGKSKVGERCLAKVTDEHVLRQGLAETLVRLFCRHKGREDSFRWVIRMSSTLEWTSESPGWLPTAKRLVWELVCCSLSSLIEWAWPGCCCVSLLCWYERTFIFGKTVSRPHVMDDIYNKCCEIKGRPHLHGVLPCTILL